MIDGQFIVLEGMDGTGKSTQAQKLKLFLEEQNKAVYLSEEPGGTPLGKILRPLITVEKGLSLTPLAELLLIESARAQHVSEVLQPKLQTYDYLISDRYSYSSLAYQGAGRGLDLTLVGELNRIATQGVEADLVIVYDLPAEEAAKRSRNRSTGAKSTQDRFEKNDLDFFNRIRATYLKLIQTEPKKFKKVDATQSADQVFQESIAIIQSQERA